MSRKKRSHYISEFYLKGFIDPLNPPHLWVYEKGNLGILKVSVKDAAVKNDYYTVSSSDGKKDSSTFEDMFAAIEGQVAPVIAKIKKGTITNNDERFILALFLALTMTRVPAFRKDIERSHSEFAKLMMQFLARDDKKFEAVMRRYSPRPKEELGISFKEIQEFILDDSKYTIETNPAVSLFMAVDLIKRLMKIFCRMNWIFFFAPDEYKFLTSDNPLFYCAPCSEPVDVRKKGLGFENVEVTFPISPELALLASWKPGDNRYLRANNSVVKAINRRTVVSSARYVFSSKKLDAISGFVQKHANKTISSKIGPVYEGADNLVISLENKCLKATDCSTCDLRLDKVLTFSRKSMSRNSFSSNHL